MLSFDLSHHEIIRLLSQTMTTSCSKLHLIWELTSFASPFKIAPSELSKPRKKEHKLTDKPKDLQTRNRPIQIVKTAPKSKEITEKEIASCFIFPRVQHSLPIKLPPGPPLPSPPPPPSTATLSTSNPRPHHPHPPQFWTLRGQVWGWDLPSWAGIYSQKHRKTYS